VAANIDEMRKALEAYKSGNKQATQNDSSPADLQSALQKYRDSQSSGSQAEIVTEIDQPGLLERSIADVRARGERAGQDIRQGLSGEQTIPEAALNYAGEAAGAAFDVAGEVISTSAKAIWDKVPDLLKEGADVGFSIIAQSPIGQEGLKAMEQGFDAYRDWKSKNPRVARSFESFFNVMLAFMPAKAKVKTGPVASKLDDLAVATENAAKKQTAKTRKEFVDKLISPKETPISLEARVPYSREIGVGPFRKTIYNPSPLEIKVSEEVSKIKGVSPHKSLQGNYSAIQTARGEIARNLDDAIRINNKDLIRAEVMTKLDDALSLEASTNPYLVGTNPERIKDVMMTGIHRLMDKRVNDEIITAHDIFKIRKEFDDILTSKKKNIFKEGSPVSASAVADLARTARDTMNKIVHDSMDNVDVQNLLDKQFYLYRATDNLAPKVAIDGKNAITRAIQRAIRIVPFRNEYVQVLGAASGLGVISASAAFAPSFAYGAGGLWLTYGAGKFLLSARTKQIVSYALKLTEKAIGTSENPGTLKQLKADRAALLEILENADTVEEQQ